MGLPLITDLKSYNLQILRNDIIAGLTVAVMLIPQGMAYALLAGLPPIYGLYAGLVPLLIYPIFGSSRFVSVGPVALISIILLAGLSNFAEPMSQEFIELAILTSLLAGVLQLLLAVFKMGFLINFLSNPVISGFTSAAAFIIGLSQLKYILGIKIPRTSSVVNMVTELMQNIGQTNKFALIVGLIGLAIILGAKKISKSIPGALIAVIFGILITIYSGWHEQGLDIVGDIPEGLPAFSVTFFSWDKIIQVLPLALVICLISFVESLSIAKVLGAKHNIFNIDANKELMGLGLAKIGGAFFQSFPNSASFTRSAINEQSGVRTGMGSVFAALIVGIILMAFTFTFYYLPKAILAAIVISAIFGLIDYNRPVYLYRRHKRDFLGLMLTFTLTLFLGVSIGVFAGIILSLMLIIEKTARPHYAILGKLPDVNSFRNINRYPEAQETEDTLILRYDQDLFFGNCEHFYTIIFEEVDKRQSLNTIILHGASFHYPDSTAIQKIELLIETCQKRDLRLVFTDLTGTVRDIFFRANIYQKLGEENFFLSVRDAFSDSHQEISNKYSAQSNRDYYGSKF